MKLQKYPLPIYDLMINDPEYNEAKLSDTNDVILVAGRLALFGYTVKTVRRAHKDWSVIILDRSGHLDHLKQIFS